MVNRVRSPELTHADYADASIVRADSEVVFLAGACPLDSHGVVVAPGDIAAQTRKALANMDVALSDCRVALQDVAFLRVMVVASTSEDLGVAWKVVKDHFGHHDVPATLQGASVLGYADQLVEIEAVGTREPS